MKDNRLIEVTYKNGKGKITTRNITNIQLDYGLYNGKEQWIVRALCCDTNKNIVIQLTETKFG
jgi:hypothetical protein